jgi:hypothetical protein
MGFQNKMMRPMIISTPVKRRNKNVAGSIYGIPKRAMMKPVLQINTNNGAANASIGVADFMKWTEA